MRQTVAINNKTCNVTMHGGVAAGRDGDKIYRER